MAENKKNKGTKTTNQNNKHYEKEENKTYEKEENQNLDSVCECEDCDCEKNACEQQKTESACREEEFKESLQRLQAEFDNYRRRNENSQEKFKEDGIVFAINKLLPVLDSFKSARQQVEDEEFLKSLDLIEKQFQEGLKALKIEKIEADNSQFNPNFHNAVLTGNEPEKPDNEILEVYQDGYKLNNRIIRHSVVKINKIN